MGLGHAILALTIWSQIVTDVTKTSQYWTKTVQKQTKKHKKATPTF